MGIGAQGAIAFRVYRSGEIRDRQRPIHSVCVLGRKISIRDTVKDECRRKLNCRKDDEMRAVEMVTRIPKWDADCSWRVTCLPARAIKYIGIYS